MFSCPSLTIPGFTHSVAEYFLSDVHEMLGRALSAPGHPQSKRFKQDNSSAKVFFFLFKFVILSIAVSKCFACIKEAHNGFQQFQALKL